MKNKEGNKNEEKKEVKEMKVRIILYLHDEECKAGNRVSWEFFVDGMFGAHFMKVWIFHYFNTSS